MPAGLAGAQVNGQPMVPAPQGGPAAGKAAGQQMAPNVQALRQMYNVDPRRPEALGLKGDAGPPQVRPSRPVADPRMQSAAAPGVSAPTSTPDIVDPRRLDSLAEILRRQAGADPRAAAAAQQAAAGADPRFQKALGSVDPRLLPRRGT
jgi:hypothetical protein